MDEDLVRVMRIRPFDGSEDWRTYLMDENGQEKLNGLVKNMGVGTDNGYTIHFDDITRSEYERLVAEETKT